MHYIDERIKIMFFFCLTSTLENPKKDKPPVHELRELIRRIGLGEEEALASLYEQTKSAVYGFALSIVKNHADAEEIMQDTFLAVDANAARYEPVGSPMGWILTITRNLAYGRIRKGKWEAAMDDLPEEAEMAAPTEQTENRMVLEAALQILGEEERQIVMLHAVSGLRHKEVAKILNLTLTGTLSKYHRALAKLRKQLGGTI